MQDHPALFSTFQRARVLLGFALAGIVASTTACDPSQSTRPDNTPTDSAYLTGRLTARHNAPTASVTPGLQVMRITTEGRPFGLFVPANYDPSSQWPIAVMLHGAGGSGEGMALEFSELANAAGLIIVAPNSYFSTWDLIISSTQTGLAQFGPDRDYIDDLMEWSFDHLSIDPARISIAGWDDGGIYSLWLGLKNGDLFTRVAAFSPCSNIPTTRTGTPRVFVSHGVNDQLFPIDECSRNMVPRLEGFGYTVEYTEYTAATANGHDMTPEVRSKAIEFLARQ